MEAKKEDTNPAWKRVQIIQSGGSVVKKLPANAKDQGSIPGSGRFPGEENGKPLQFLCLEKPIKKEAWWAIQSTRLQRVRHDQATEEQQLFSTFTYKNIFSNLKKIQLIDPVRTMVLLKSLKMHHINEPLIRFFKKASFTT